MPQTPTRAGSAALAVLTMGTALVACGRPGPGQMSSYSLKRRQIPTQCGSLHGDLVTFTGSVSGLAAVILRLNEVGRVRCVLTGFPKVVIRSVAGVKLKASIKYSDYHVFPDMRIPTEAILTRRHSSFLLLTYSNGADAPKAPCQTIGSFGLRWRHSDKSLSISASDVINGKTVYDMRISGPTIGLSVSPPLSQDPTKGIE